MTQIIERPFSAQIAQNLAAQGLSPTMARVLAARGIVDAGQLDSGLAQLLPPAQLTHCAEMAVLLADAIAQDKKLLIIGDYDADGATATAVAIRGLRSMAARVDFLVPNRFEYGYGLTPEIVDLAAGLKPDVIITVDNGIASVDGVARANALGLTVLVTDHHLPAATLPQAACIVNPNQSGCTFASKNLAGVGVIFYVMLALRAELRQRGVFATQPEPNLTELLDLVALGTVADLVKLDDNNRILVEQGLRRMRQGKCCAGIRALMQVAGRELSRISAQDLGFSVGPRLNAAGRLDDMSLGIACLICDDETQAQQMAQQLHELNLERRNIEADMQDAAHMALQHVDVQGRYSLSMFDADWHQGVIGILASRLKELHHRPVIAFARASDSAEPAILKGSGRSISALHLRDALDLLSKQDPNLLLKFGGHAMAAGLSILEADFERFSLAFERVVASLLRPQDLDAVIEVDGALAIADMAWETACTLERQVWGQGFPAPMFCDEFDVLEQRVLADKHLKLSLSKAGKKIDAIFFQQASLLPNKIRAVYQLQTNVYKGVQNIQLNLKLAQAL